jgi:branched-chain amino acid transport system ATP-binding protein
MSALLEVTALFKSYGPVPVLRDVNLAVAERETLAIIGPNGAGKTTLFKTLTGEALPEQGRIMFAGRDVTNLPAQDRVALGFGRTFQVSRVYLETSLVENVVVAIEARKRRAGESLGAWHAYRPAATTVLEAEEWLASVGLAARRDNEARFLSHGDKKRLELAIALALRPKILMMDEPTAGMSPSDRVQTVDLVMRMRERHQMTVLLTEHDMDVVFGLSDRIIVLNYGQVVAIGSGEEIRANQAVRDIYLGHEVQHA